MATTLPIPCAPARRTVLILVQRFRISGIGDERPHLQVVVSCDSENHCPWSTSDSCQANRLADRLGSATAD